MLNAVVAVVVPGNICIVYEMVIMLSRYGQENAGTNRRVCLGDILVCFREVARQSTLLGRF